MTSESSELRRIGLALSFSNLVFLRVWFDLLAGPSSSIYPKYAAGARDYAAALVNVLLLAALAWCLIRAGRSMRQWQRQALVFLGLLLVANAVRGVGAYYTPWLRSGLFRFVTPGAIAAAAFVVAAAASVAMIRHFALAMMLARGLLFAALPAFFVTSMWATVRIMRPSRVAPDPPLAAAQQTEPGRGRRVVWVIFDEWDQRLSFEDRPKGLELPELDRLVAKSLAGTRVLGPQGDMPVTSMATQVAIPSLLAGAPRGVNRFERPHIFSQLHDRGWNVAIGGWYIPYCRVFAGDAFRCYWDQMYTQANEESASFAEALAIQQRSLFETSLYSLFGQSVTSRKHAREYQSILRFALEQEQDASAGLLFLHFNVPHAPYFYDPATGRFDAPGSSVAAYRNALQLVDKTIGSLAAHLDGQTVLILSADHPLRRAADFDGKTDARVPFVLHWPGQANALRDEVQFSSLETAPLILEILEGRVNSAEDAMRYLDDTLRQR